MLFRSDCLAVLSQELDVLAQTLVALLGAEGQRDLGTPEAHGLGCCRLGAGAVEVDALLHGPSDEAVDGLVPQLAQQIPESEVDDGDDGDGQTLTTVEHGPAVHLLEQKVGIAGVCADEEALEMLVNQPARRRACRQI